ncbi:hypothetical protein [Streptomyces taklimakanensis]|nr:hypothetical protein [Streptomyces taklimakanensis]
MQDFARVHQRKNSPGADHRVVESRIAWSVQYFLEEFSIFARPKTRG